MSIDVAAILTKLASQKNKTFTYRGEQLPIETVFAYSGTLSIFIRKANLLSDFLFGGQLNVSLISDSDALTGERVVINEQQNGFALIMLLYDVLEEMIVNAGSDSIVLQ